MDNINAKHPNGMWYLGCISGLFCFSVGTIFSLLILYLTQQLHMTEKTAYSIFAAFMAVMYTLPLLGGYIGGQFGYKKSISFSVLLMITGLLFLQHTTVSTLYIGLGLFALGYGFYLPNIYLLLGKQYAADSGKRDSGFTLFYALYNSGYLCSFVLGGYLQADYGFHLSFMIAMVPLIIAFLSFPLYLWPMQAHSSQSYVPLAKVSTLISWLIIIGVSILGGGLCFVIMSYADISKYLILALVISTILGILYLALKQQEKTQTYKLFVYIILAVISIGFWALYMLEPSLLTLFIKHNVARVVWGHVIPPSTFIGLNPLFTISLGALYGMLWLRLAQKGKDLSVPAKFSISLFSMCLGFFVLYLATIITGNGMKVSFWWMFLVYFFLSTAELLISPIGQSAVGRLAPKKYEGFLMGAWQVFIGASASLSGLMASFAAIPKHTSLGKSDHIYGHNFLHIALMTLLVAAISVLLVPFLKRAMYPKSDSYREIKADPALAGG